jgi:two-component system response regulator NreC
LGIGVGIVRILIADDNQMIRRGIASLLSNEDGYEVCGEAANAEEAIQRTNDLRPDVVLLDVSMPGTNGLNTARLLRQQAPKITILIVSHHDLKQLLPRALEAGADGCLDKARIATDLLPTLRNMLKPPTV